MTYFNGTSVFAELKEETQNEKKTPIKDERKIHVQETGKASLPPDRVKCIITCANTKETAEQVKHSVSRRVDYITQTLRNNNIKPHQYTLHQLISPTDTEQYRMCAEIVVEFHDVFTFEKTVNWLVEKLESSIKISEPSFYHSAEKLTDLRRKASLNALHNCRSKALSMAQLLNQKLGSPILVQEEDIREFNGFENEGSKNDMMHSIQQKIDNNTVNVVVKMFAIFECSDRTKTGLHK